MVDLISLAQAGPVAILLVMIAVLYRAFVKGDVVPGTLYREAIARAEKAETQAERNTDALEAVTATVRQALDSRGPADA